jgi:hypothetical protein
MLHRLLIVLKSIYALQPYHVGSKRSKSLVICIPSKVAKKYNISTSTVFALHADKKTKKILLQTLSEVADEKIISTESLAGNRRSESSEKQ